MLEQLNNTQVAMLEPESISNQEHVVINNNGKLGSETVRNQSGINSAQRKHSINFDYFKTFTHNMAYILGYTVTDRNVMVDMSCDFKQSSNRRPIYKLAWNCTDLEVLEFIKKDMMATYPIRPRKDVNPKFKNLKPSWELAINSKELVMDILLLGITPRKSKTAVFQDWYPEEFMPDYVRGIIDGDGCWTTQNNSGEKIKPMCEVYSGSKVFLDGIGDYLKSKIGIIPKIHTRSNDVSVLRYGSREVAALFSYVNNGGFMLKRKFERATELIKGFDTAKCKKCGQKFVRVAGLQNFCKVCKDQIKIQSKLAGDSKELNAHA